MALKSGIGKGDLQHNMLWEPNVEFNLCELQIELQ
jgi:hypothetical protein